MSKLILASAVALVDDQNRVLLAQRPEGKHLAGLWEFPGGKFEVGETAEAALVRELAEELLITVAEKDLVPVTFASHAYENFYLLMPLFLCRVWQGDIVPTEGQKVAFVDPADFAQYPCPPADAPLMPVLQQILTKQ